MFLVEIALLILGGLGCWSVHRQAVGLTRRCVGIGFFTVLFFLPVAWFEGRWVHWWLLQPRIGEPLAAVVGRLGVAVADEKGRWEIDYVPPFFWVVPQFGSITVSTDSAGLVESWDATWR